MEHIQRYPEAFRPLFCQQQTPLTASAVDDLFTIRLSEQGSNRRTKEEAVVAFWRDFLEEAEGKHADS